MGINGVGLTDVGRRRKSNEDALVSDDALGLYVVSDGMGGYEGGEVASHTAVTAVHAHVKAAAGKLAAWRRTEPPENGLSQLVEEATLAACEQVYDKATASPEKAGMGCTLTTLLVCGSRAAMAHVGDSRLYLSRDGRCFQLSTDHTLVQELLDAGLIAAEAARTHPYRSVLNRALGRDRATRVDTLEFLVLSGDRFVLCSDGFCGYVPTAEWLAGQLAGTLEEVAPRLVEYANESGGSDNITVIVAEAGERGVSPEDTMKMPRPDLDGEALAALFGPLRLPSRTRIFDAGTVVSCDAGEVVVEAGRPVDAMYICLEGRLEGGASPIVPGACFGESALFVPTDARTTIRAKESSRLLKLQRDGLMRLVRRRPKLGARLLARLATRVSQGVDPLRWGE